VNTCADKTILIMIDSILKTAKILIVDDKQSNIDILEGLLEESGYENFQSTTDPRLVIDLFNSFNPDLILLDLMMPHLSGFEVMEQLKPLIPQGTYLPILVLTADITSESKLRALSGGAKDFLSKPFDLYEVQIRINNLLETRYLYKQLENQNQILEERVKERTRELALTNRKLSIEKDKALESNRLKTAFLNNISHEIRTPLNGILGFSSLITQPEIEQEEKEGFLQYLNNSSDRLLKTIIDITDMSLIISGGIVVNITEIDCLSLIQDLNDSFIKRCTENNLELKINHLAQIQNIEFKTDRELLFKSLSHIIDNSIKFTSKGSITLGFDLQDDQLLITISDTGAGIDKNAQERIWEFFMQENNSNTRLKEGNGLGLSIAAGMIKLLGGKISLESEKQLGTSVFISLPVEQSFVNAKLEFTTKTDKLRNLSTVLIAEDDDTNKLVLQTMLKNLAPDFLLASTGKEAIEICRNNKNIDLILMDIRMPELNGYEATRQIREFNKDVLIIAQTAYGLTGDREKAIKTGCNDYIAKPIKNEELLALIRKYFEV
jgi:CheY-like chemotaxis protein